MESTNHHNHLPPAQMDAYDRFAADPYSSAPQTPPKAPIRKGHGGHGLMHLLMCAPMLLVVGYLIFFGGAPLGTLGYALVCMIMMSVMMLFMNKGSGGGHAGHRH